MRSLPDGRQPGSNPFHPSRDPLAAILPLFPRCLQFPIPLGLNLVLFPSEAGQRRVGRGVCYLEVFGYGGYEALGEITGQAIEGGILLLEEAFYVGGNFVFVAEDEFVGVVENLLRFGLRQGDFATDGDEHGGSPARLRV